MVDQQACHGLEVVGAQRPARAGQVGVDGHRDLGRDDGRAGRYQVVEDRRPREGHHVVSELGAASGGGLGRVPAGRVHGHTGGGLDDEADAQRRRVHPGIGQIGTGAGRGPVGVAGHGPGGGVEGGRTVPHRAGDHVLRAHAVPAFAPLRADGDAPTGRLEAEEPATGGGNADGTAAVAGVGHGEDARGHCGRRTAARAARGHAEVPWVVGGPGEGGLSARAQAQLRRVRLGHEHQPCPSVAGDDLRVAGAGRSGSEEAAAVGGGQPGHVGPQVLDGEGHPPEGTGWQPGVDGPAGPVLEQRGHRVDRRVDRLDRGHGLVEEVVGRDFARPDQLGQAEAIVGLDQVHGLTRGTGTGL